jgi:hypothetical protein
MVDRRGIEPRGDRWRGGPAHLRSAPLVGSPESNREHGCFRGRRHRPPSSRPGRRARHDRCQVPLSVSVRPAGLRETRPATSLSALPRAGSHRCVQGLEYPRRDSNAHRRRPERRASAGWATRACASSAGLEPASPRRALDPLSYDDARAEGRTRTACLRLTRAPLYQVSYLGVLGAVADTSAPSVVTLARADTGICCRALPDRGRGAAALGCSPTRDVPRRAGGRTRTGQLPLTRRASPPGRLRRRAVCPRRDSNAHWPASRPGASAVWATRTWAVGQDWEPASPGPIPGVLAGAPAFLRRERALNHLLRSPTRIRTSASTSRASRPAD